MAIAFILLDRAQVFLAFNLIFNFFVFLLAWRLKEKNIITITLIVTVPIVVETIVFGFGLIDLSSTADNILIHNSIIFGYHLIVEILILFMLMKRSNITRWFCGQQHVKHTFADDLLPWVFLFGVFVAAATLLENYLRIVKDYEMTFFFYSMDVVGYVSRTVVSSTLVMMVFREYQNGYRFSYKKTGGLFRVKKTK
ncbi:hypothetical protein ACSLBF_02435 [Pseudoalteromonas sp. T1lg65]|uniref:hypothetical protein n=1 Tax=Pseudoalteromonas sp. T1lg65 TaxID=2077101 RepID=UPI003F7B0D1C